MARASSRTRFHLRPLVLAALAAGIAYLAAGQLFGPREAFFAPIAAVLCVGSSTGRQLRRAGEIALGVALGLLAADLVSRGIGQPVLALVAAVLIARLLALLAGEGALMANQASVAAVVVVALGTEEGPLVRLLDALIGGAVGLLVVWALGPDPVRRATGLAGRMVAELGATVRSLAAGLRDADPEQVA
ncbi:MAG TPA: FUSC family protein, partial [Actinotalea sp.]|nr:FUSC family protein [Actinotalea sp.]